MDKPWRERSELGVAPWDTEYIKDHRRNWNVESTTALVDKELGSPQARVAMDRWSGNSNAWSAALGAMGGAGTVLLFAAILLIWRRPRRTEPHTLAPMDVGQNAFKIQS
ncbi:uncharacterized protein LOC123721015 [Papilio machaon]|uniref:uncharacterized protein LOC123721015 n=1 Tax=Papilio machaon TaxID=76193 RepID=UPI001E6632C0|nr:uncharacterized protein LOC123721015 [Papilio machaon]